MAGLRGARAADVADRGDAAWQLLASAADSTDVHAFVSPDRPDTVTLIANYVPLQEAAGGPNFYEFGDDVLYEMHVGNRADGAADISYQFRFVTKLTTPSSFLYNTGPACLRHDSTLRVNSPTKTHWDLGEVPPATPIV